MRRLINYLTLLLLVAIIATPDLWSAAPVTQAKYLGFSNITQNSATVSWTNGSGGYRMVIIRPDGANPTVPNSVANTVVQAVDAVYDNDASVGGANFFDNSATGEVVYNASGSTRTVTITGLNPGTAYEVFVIEYNKTTTNKDFNTNVGSNNNPRTFTTALAPPNLIPTDNITATSARLNWDEVIGVDGYIVNLQYGDENDHDFSDGTFSNYSDYSDLDVGNLTSLDVSGLTKNLDHRYQAKSYKGSAFSAYSTYTNPNSVSVSAGTSDSPEFYTDNDATAPKIMSIALYSDAAMTNLVAMPNSQDKSYIKDGLYYVKVLFSEPLQSLPTMRIDGNDDNDFTDNEDEALITMDQMDENTYWATWNLNSSAVTPMVNADFDFNATDLAGNNDADADWNTMADEDKYCPFVDNTAPTDNTASALVAGTPNATGTTSGSVDRAGYWNAGHTGLDLPTSSVALENDDNIVGGTIDVEIDRAGDDNYVPLGSTYTILAADKNAVKTLQYIASLIEDEGLTDGQNMKFRITFTDRAGNATSGLVTSNTMIDQTKPTISIAALSTNNSSGTHAKSGDNVVVSFTSSEQLFALGTSDVTIQTLNNTARMTDAGSAPWDNSATLTLAGSETQGGAEFSIGTTVTDLAGNNLASAYSNSNTAPTIIDFTPPVANTGADYTLTTTTNPVSAYWNEDNTQLTVRVTFGSDLIDEYYQQPSLEGGNIKLQADINNANTYSDITGASATIIAGDLIAGYKDIVISAVNFEAADGGVADGNNVQFRAVVTDVAGNATDYAESTPTLTIDQTDPNQVTAGNITVVSLGAPVNANYFNGLNTGIRATVTFPNDETIVGAAAQIQISFDGGTNWVNLGSSASIVDDDATQDFTFTETDLDNAFDDPIQDGNTVKFRANIKDIAGNGTPDSPTSGLYFTLGATSTQTYTIDQTAPTVIITRNAVTLGTNATKTTTDNTVSFDIDYSEQVMNFNQSDITINLTGTVATDALGAITVDNAGLGEYTQTVDNITGDGTLGITIVGCCLSDLAGNPLGDDAVSGLYNIDNTAPTIDALTQVSNNPTASGAHTDFAKDGAEITITLNINENFHATPFTAATAEGNNIVGSVAAGADATIKTLNWTVAGALNKSLTYSITAQDLAGNTSTFTQTNQTGTNVTLDNDPPGITTLVMNSNNSTTANDYAKTGDNVTIEVTADENLSNTSITSNNSINDANNSPATDPIGPLTITDGDGDANAVATWVASSALNDGNLTFSIELEDKAGNLATFTQANLSSGGQIILDNTAPNATTSSISISSNNAVSPQTRAKDGNSITVEIVANENLNSITSPTFEELAATANSNNGDGDAMTWDMSWTAAGSLNKNLAFSVDLKDFAGNITNVTEANLDDANIVLDNTNPSVTDLTITSNNGINNKYAKDAAVVTIEINANEDLNNITAATVEANDVIGSLTNNGDGLATTWDVNWTVAGDLDKETAFSITLQDLAGNTAVKTESNISAGGNVTLDNTLPTVTITKNAITNGDSGGFTTNDDAVSFDINFDEEVDGFTNADVSKIGTNAANATVGSLAIDDLAAGEYTQNITAITGDGTLGIQLESTGFTDLAGNQMMADANSTDFTIDNTAPTKDGLTVVSDNTINNKFARTAHVLTFTVDANEDLSATNAVNNITVQGASVGSYASTNAQVKTFTYTVLSTDGDGGSNENTDLAATITDIAGNNLNLTESDLVGGNVVLDNNVPTAAINTTTSNVSNGAYTTDAKVNIAEAAAIFTISANNSENDGDIFLVDATTHTTVNNSFDFATNADYTVSGDATGGTNVDIVVPANNGGTDWDDAHTYKVYVRDEAGNVSAAATPTITVDLTAPSIAGRISTSPSSGVRKIGDEVEIVVLAGNASEEGLVNATGTPSTINGVSSLAFLETGSGQYKYTYTVAEGNTDIADASPLPISLRLKDAAGNESGAFTSHLAGQGPGVDATRPAVTTVTSNATGAGILKVGNTIVFTIDPTGSEPNATVTGSYNGQTLTWGTSNGGDTYTATYTVTEGEEDQDPALQITGVNITDENGNADLSANDGSDVVKTIDANSPSASTISAITINYDDINGKSTSGYINSGTTSLDITFNLNSNDGSLDGGSAQIQAKIGAGSWTNITGSGVSSITNGERNAQTKTINVLESDLDDIGYVDGNVISFRVNVSDLATNLTNGNTYGTTYTVNQTSPVIGSTALNGEILNDDFINIDEHAAGTTMRAQSSKASTTLYLYDATLNADAVGTITELTSEAETLGSAWTATTANTDADFNIAAAASYIRNTPIACGLGTTHQYKVYGIDAAGNVSSLSGVNVFQTDLTPPCSTTVAEEGTTKLADGYYNITESGTSTTIRVGLHASAVAGDIIELTLGGASFDTPKTRTLDGTDITNTYYDFTFLNAHLGAEGSKSISSKITDLHGNVGESSNSEINFVKDITAPFASTVMAQVGSGLYHNVDNTNWYYNNQTDGVTFKIPLDDDASLVDGTVQLKIDDDGDASYANLRSSYTIMNADIDGYLYLETTDANFVTDNPSEFAEGNTITVTATVTDIAGNSTTLNSCSFIHDETQPAAQTVTVTSVNGNVVSGYYNSTNNSVEISVDYSSNNMNMNDETLFNGYAQPQVSFNGTVWANLGDPVLIPNVTNSDLTTYTFLETQLASAQDEAELLDDATVLFRVNVTDAAGNQPVTNGTSSSNFIIDQTPPTATYSIINLFGGFTGSKTDHIINIAEKAHDQGGGDAGIAVRIGAKNSESLGMLYVLNTTDNTGPYTYSYIQTNSLYSATGHVTPNGNTLIPVPSNHAGIVNGKTYKMFAIDQAGNPSIASTDSFTADLSAPTITSASYSPSSGVQAIGETVVATVSAGASEDGLVNGGDMGSTAPLGTASQINGVDATFAEVGAGDYSFTYTVVENNSDIADAADLPVSFVLVDAAGNPSSAFTTTSAGTKPGVDAHRPVLTSVTSNATGAGILKIGNTITFTATPASTELGAEVTGSYNDVDLTWSTSDAGATYTATYTVAQDHSDRTTALQITGVNITDVNGNVAAATTDGSDVVKTIDAHVPGVSTIASITPLYDGSTNEVAGYINSGVTDLEIVVSIPQISNPTTVDDASMNGGTVKIQASTNGGDNWQDFANNSFTVTGGEVIAHSKTVTIDEADLDDISGYNAGTLSFRAILSDVATNSTNGTIFGSTFVVDQTAPVLTAAADKITGEESGFNDNFINANEKATGFNMVLQTNTTNTEILVWDNTLQAGEPSDYSDLNTNKDYNYTIATANSDDTKAIAGNTAWVRNPPVNCGTNHSYELYGMDAAGNISSALAIFTTDLTKPTVPVSVTEVTNTYLSDGYLNIVEADAGLAVSVTLPATCVNANGSTDRLELFLNGSSFGTPKFVNVSAGDITAGFVNFTGINQADLGSDGVKHLSAKLRDDKGNWTDATSDLTFTLDYTAPTAGTVTHVSGLTEGRHSANLYYNENSDGATFGVNLAEDATLIDGNIVLSLDKDAGASYTNLVAAGTLPFTITQDDIVKELTITDAQLVANAEFADNATILVRATVTDVAGNPTTWTALTIHRDETDPTAPSSINLTAVGGTVVADYVNGENTNLTGGATIVAGEATDGDAYLKFDGTSIAQDNSIAGGDVAVSFNLGTSTTNGLQTATGMEEDNTVSVTVDLYDDAGNLNTGNYGTNLVKDYTRPTATISLVEANGSALEVYQGKPTVNRAEIGAASVKFRADFNEDMNTSFTPTFSFYTGGEQPTTAFTNPSTAFSNNSGTNNRFERTNDVADVDLTIANVDVDVTGARDLAGNLIDPNPTQNANLFHIDLHAPTISSSSYSANGNTSGYVDITFNEDVFTDLAATSTSFVEADLDGGDEVTEGANGQVTDASVTSLSSQSATVVRVNVDFTGTNQTGSTNTSTYANKPSGSETITLSPAANAIYDKYGNPVADAATTGAQTLVDKLPPFFTMQYHYQGATGSTPPSSPVTNVPAMLPASSSYNLTLAADASLNSGPTYSLEINTTPGGDTYTDDDDYMGSKPFDKTNQSMTLTTTALLYKVARPILSNTYAKLNGRVKEVVTVTASDINGNTATNVNPINMATKQAVWDTKVPEVTSISLLSTNTDRYTNQNNVTFRVFFNDTIIGLATDQVALRSQANAITGGLTISSIQINNDANDATFDYDINISMTNPNDNGKLGFTIANAGDLVQDAAGNIMSAFSTSASQEYLVDNTAPTISAGVFTAPVSTTEWRNIAQIITWNSENITDATVNGVSSGFTANSLQLEYDGAGTFTPATLIADPLLDPTSAYYASPTEVFTGNYNTAKARFRITDKAGNLSSDLVSSTFIIDNITPTAANLAKTESNTYYKEGSTVTLTYDITEANHITNAPEVKVYESDGTTLIGSASLNTPSYPDNAGGANSYTYTVPSGNFNNVVVKVEQFADQAGNQSANPATSLTNAFTIDNTAPNFAAPTVTALTNTVRSGYYNGTNNGLNITFAVPADNTLVGGSIDLKYKVNGGTAQDLGAISNYTILVGDLNGNKTFNLTDVEFTTIAAENDVITFYATILDQAGNSQNTNGTDIKRDETAPTLATGDIVVNDGMLSDPNVGENNFTIEATFSEPMHASGTPTASFNPAVATTLNTTGSTANEWSTTSKYKFYYNVTDAGLTLNDVDIIIAGTPTDLAGNAFVPSTTKTAAFDIDTQNPIFVESSSENADGSYLSGDEIYIAVTFDEEVHVTGQPLLTLSTGTPTTTDATFSPNAVSTSVWFLYTVGANNNTSDLDYASTSALSLNTGMNIATIRDVNGNDAVLTLASPGSMNSLGDVANIVIDNVKPTITNTTNNATNSYLTVTFDQAVYTDRNNVGPNRGNGILTASDFTATVTPNAGGNVDGATITSLTNTVGDPLEGGETSIRVNYTLTGDLLGSDQAGKASGTETIAITVASASSVYDLAGNAMSTTQSNNSAALNDKLQPWVTDVTSTKINGTYRDPEVIAVTVSFSENVTVTGTPQLTLEAGASDPAVNYTSGSTTNTLTFNYTVADGHNNSDLDYTATNALALNAGTIRDAANNNALLSLAAPGATHSLGANKDLVIDTQEPTVSSFSPSDGATTVEATSNLVITFDSPIYQGTAGNVVIYDVTNSNAVFETIPYNNAKLTIDGTTLTINPAGTLKCDNDYAVQVGGSVVKDFAGNYYAGIADNTTWNFHTKATLDLDVLSANYDVCETNTLSINGPAGYSSYSWKNQANSQVSTSQNLSFANIAEANEGTWTLEVTNSNGCIGTETFAVTVNPLPAVDAGSDFAVCVNQTINLSTTMVTGATYSWTGPNGYTSSLRNPSISGAVVANSGNYTVVTTITATGCTNTDVVAVTVNTLPTITFTAAPTTACINDVKVYTTQADQSSYTWTVSGVASTDYVITAGGTTSDNSISVQWLTSGSKSVSVNYANSNSCMAASATVANTTVNTLPSTATGTGAERCGTGTLVLSASGASAGSVYKWYSASSGGSLLKTSSSNTDNTYTTPSIGTTTTYYVTIVNANTCESSTRTSVTATINTIPSAPTVTNGETCGTGVVVLGASGAGGGETYRWYLNNTDENPIIGATGASYTTPSISSTTTYYVSIRNGSCESSRTMVTATVNPIPSTATASASPVCVSGTSVLTGIGAGAGESYKWYSASSGGSALHSGSTYTTGTISTTTAYYVSKYNTTTTCESGRTLVNATVYSLPSGPTALDGFVCGNGTVTVGADGATSGQKYKWYDAASAGTLLKTSTDENDNEYSESINATTTFYVTILNNATGCESSPRVAVIGEVKPTVSAQADIPSGTQAVSEGQTITYTTSAVANATGYNWNYSGANVSINSYIDGGIPKADITFGAGATDGDLTVRGYNVCGNGDYSDALAIDVQASETFAIENQSSEPAGISSIVNDATLDNTTTGSLVWKFRVQDDVNGNDAKDVNITGITITQGTGNEATSFTDYIRKAALYNADGSAWIANATVNASNLTFTGLTLSTANAQYTDYQLRISLNTSLPNGADNVNFAFKISESNVTLGANSTGKGVFTVQSNAAQNEIDVVATKTRFTSNPPFSLVTNNVTTGQVVVQAVDANNNIDLDYTSNITLSGNDVTVLSGNTVVASAGVATYNSLKIGDAYATGATTRYSVTQTLTATGTSLANTATTSTFTVRAPEPEAPTFGTLSGSYQSLTVNTNSAQSGKVILLGRQGNKTGVGACNDDNSNNFYAVNLATPMVDGEYFNSGNFSPNWSTNATYQLEAGNAPTTRKNYAFYMGNAGTIELYDLIRKCRFSYALYSYDGDVNNPTTLNYNTTSFATATRVTLKTEIDNSDVLSNSNFQHFTVDPITPNPAKDNINVGIDVNDESKFTIEMYDIAGQVVYTEFSNRNLTSGNYNFKIALPGDKVSSGTYYLRVANESFDLMIPFVVVK